MKLRVRPCIVCGANSVDPRIDRRLNSRQRNSLGPSQRDTRLHRHYQHSPAGSLAQSISLTRRIVSVEMCTPLRFQKRRLRPDETRIGTSGRDQGRAACNATLYIASHASGRSNRSTKKTRHVCNRKPWREPERYTRMYSLQGSVGIAGGVCPHRREKRSTSFTRPLCKACANSVSV